MAHRIGEGWAIKGISPPFVRELCEIVRNLAYPAKSESNLLWRLRIVGSDANTFYSFLCLN
jgi:hypothetical protein